MKDRVQKYVPRFLPGQLVQASDNRESSWSGNPEEWLSSNGMRVQIPGKGPAIKRNKLYLVIFCSEGYTCVITPDGSITWTDNVSLGPINAIGWWDGI